MTEQQNEQIQLGTQEHPYDVVIVGGGITGLYCLYNCLYKLLKNKKKKVALFEASNRLGGRIETVEFDDFHAEFGPMRFEFPSQEKLKKLAVDELKIDYQEFPEYRSEHPQFPVYNIFDKYEMRCKDNLELFFLAIIRIFKRGLEEDHPLRPRGDINDHLDPLNKLWLQLLTENDYKKIKKDTKVDNIELYKLGIWNALHSAISHTAITKIRDTGTFYHFIGQNPNAAEWIIFWLRALKSVPTFQLRKKIEKGICIDEFDGYLDKNGKVDESEDGLNNKIKQELDRKSTDKNKVKEKYDKLYFFTNGSKTIVDELEKKINQSDKDCIHKNHLLISIQNNDDGVELTFKNSGQEISARKIYAKEIILAIPQVPLKKIVSASQNFPLKIQNHINRIIPITLLKCFFLVDDPWWKNEVIAQNRASLMPTREVHYKSNENQDKGLIFMYSDTPSSEYWSTFIQDDKFDENKNELQYHDQAEIYNHDEERINEKGEKLGKQDENGLKRQFFKNMIDENIKEKKLNEHLYPLLDPLFKDIIQLINDEKADKNKLSNDLKILQKELTGWGLTFKEEKLEDFISKAKEALIEKMSQRIIKYGIRDWGREPYGAAVHTWQPGIRSEEVLNDLKAFSLNNSLNKNIHVCGEAFCDYNGFIEGCLRSADDVLDFFKDE